jgi:KaiC/GvpD/RAD55 family RecA-like ATPase
VNRSDYYSGSDFLYRLPFGAKGKIFYDNYYWTAHELLKTPLAEWEQKIVSINEKFSTPYSAFENQSDPHLNLGLEGSLRAYNEPPTHKTRVYSLITEMLGGALAEQANLTLRTRGNRDRRKHLLPSPLHFLRSYLTDPNFPASDAYAHVIIRSIIFAGAIQHYQQLKASGKRNNLERTTGLPPGETPIEIIRHFTSYDLVVDALRKIGLHRTIRDVAYPTNPSDFIVAHFLASRGYMLLSFPLTPSSGKEGRDRRESREDFIKRGSLIGDAGLYEFRLAERVQSLPPASELINEIDGLPIAIPNADIIFARGLRFTGSEGTVLRLTGPSGGGKTSFALGLATALAPLGINTLYLSCEENEDDLERRIQTLVPYFIRRTETYRAQKSLRTWFEPRHLREGPDVDLASINRLIDDFINAHGASRSVDVTHRPPGLTPLMIVLDGIHELMLTDRQDSHRKGESRRLRNLVENLRRTGALIVFMSANLPDPAVADLDYVADLVADIALEKTDEVSEPLVRKFVLRKTRRQFARMGAHLLNLSPRVGVALTPQLAAQRDVHRDFRWVTRSTTSWFDIFRQSSAARGAENTHSPLLYEFSQILVTGRGSSGKAAFALRLIAGQVIRNFNLKTGKGGDLFDRKTQPNQEQQEGARELLAELGSQKKSRRILVISFLYQQVHYDDIYQRLRRLPRSRFLEVPPELKIDVQTFYPGHLNPEDFLRKLVRSLEVGALEGQPYEAVIIDGLHNVFMQFPRLQENKVLWPITYEILRKYRLTIVTTHTHMELPGSGANLALDLNMARERAAPILQALINAADFFFDVSAEVDNRNRFVIHTVNASDQPFPSDLIWDRNTLFIEPKPRENGGKSQG